MLISKANSPRVALKTKAGRAIAGRVPTVAREARILIVDQDRGVGRALTFMLAARQYDEVRAVRSAERAMAIAGQFRPEIVFLDLDLPDGGSNGVARQLNGFAHPGRPRLIALTKDAEQSTREAGRLVGFERFLEKPVSHEELDEVLGIAGTAT